MVSGHRFDAQTLHSFIQAVFRQMGSEEQEAKLVADHLIAANLAGHDSHGIGMIPSYVRSCLCYVFVVFLCCTPGAGRSIKMQEFHIAVG